jgi:hypothetical protein
MLGGMDAQVLAAMAKWPDVPDVYGWLALTARGQWRLRGEPIANAAMVEFIGRNYAHDGRGCWYFQNGPQRVFVELELAPWVLRLQRDGTMRTHTGGAPRSLLGAALLDGTSFVLLTDLGAGGVDDRDAERLLAALGDEAGAPLDDAALERALADGRPLHVVAARCGLGAEVVPLQRLAAAQAQAAFGFRRRPSPDPGT